MNTFKFGEEVNEKVFFFFIVFAVCSFVYEQNSYATTISDSGVIAPNLPTHSYNCNTNFFFSNFDSSTGDFICNPAGGGGENTTVTTLDGTYSWFQGYNMADHGNLQFYGFDIGKGLSVSAQALKYVINTSFYANTISCNSGYFISDYNNSTGILTCTLALGSTTLDTISNIGTGEASIYAGNTTNTNFQYKTLKQGQGITLSNNTNDVTIKTNFKVNNISCAANNYISSFSNTTGTYTCTALPVTAAITSINSDTTAAQTIAGGQGITISDSGATHSVKTNFKTNNITCSAGNAVTDFSNTTGTYTCSPFITTDTNTAQVVNADNGQTLISSTFNATETKLMSLRNATGYVLFNHNTTSITPSFQFKTNTITCTNQFLSAFNNSTGIFTCTSGNAGTITGSNNVGRAAGSVGVLSTPSSSLIKGRNMTGTSPVTVTKTNDTDIAIGCSTCLTSAITSLNSDTTAAQNIVSGKAGNMTVTNSTGKVTLDLGYRVVIIDGSTQTITKGLTLNSLTLGGQMNLAGNTFLNTGTITFPTTTTTLGGLALTQNWTGNNTEKFGAGGIIIRNPASTFTTKIEGGAVTANRTLNLPLLTQTETLALKPNINFSASSNKTGTSSLTGVMLGDGITLTPTVTGRVEVTVSGYITTSVAADGCVLAVRQGTTGSPANAAAITLGTQIGSNLYATGGATADRVPFSETVQITGLTTGTKVWVELGEKALTGGTCTVFNTNWAIKEI